MNNTDYKTPIEKLLQLREGFPKTIIAGGFVRDMFFNKPYKDVDIFLGGNKKLGFCFIIDELLPQIFGENSDMDYPNPEFNSRGGESYTIDIKSEDGIWYQLVFLGRDPAEEVRYGFDLNINQIYHNGVKIIRTKSFEDLLKNKEIKRNPGATLIISNKRLERLLLKYPEFKPSNELIEKLKIIEKPSPAKKAIKAKHILIRPGAIEELVLANPVPGPEQPVPGLEQQIQNAILDNAAFAVHPAQPVQPGEWIIVNDNQR